jgi:hypothetical protein
MSCESSSSSIANQPKTYNPRELTEKVVLRLYSKLLIIAMKEYEFDSGYDDEDDDKRDDEADCVLAKFVHILLKGFAIKSRGLLLQETKAAVNNDVLCIENILIQAKLVQMNFLYFLQYNHKYNLDISYIIKETIKRDSRDYDVVTLIASAYKNDCLTVGDLSMFNYIIESFDDSVICDICRKVICGQDNFEEMGQFLVLFGEYICLKSGIDNDDKSLKKDNTNTLLEFLISIFDDDILTEAHGQVSTFLTH